MLIKFFILLIIAMLIPSAGFTEDALGSIELSGGRPLHQARNFKRDLQDIYRKYAYIRCVNFQLAKHFGSENYNEQEKLLPDEMADMLDMANGYIGSLEANRDYLLQHHRDSFNDNIAWETQKSINSFKKEINDFQSDFDKLFETVSNNVKGLGKTSLCDRVLTRQ